MSDLKHYQLIAQPSMEGKTVIDLWSTPENIDALERTLRRLVFPNAFQLYVCAGPQAELVKPPLGVLPLYLWQESNPNPDVATRAQRAIKVAQAVQRYYEAGELVNPEWLSEIGIRGVRPNVNPQFWDRNIIRPTGRDPAQTTGGSGQESPEGK